MYEFRLFGAAGTVVAVQQFFAFNDDEALSIASNMMKGAEPTAKFDVWKGERRVGSAVPTPKEPSRGRPITAIR